MLRHGIWLLQSNAIVSNRMGSAALQDANVGVENYREIAQAWHCFARAHPLGQYQQMRLPPDFPRPRLGMPVKYKRPYAPDYVGWGGDTFVSRRFREALAQPEDVVEYTPVELIYGTPEAHAQDYMMFRVLACQPAMDVGRSDCKVEIKTTPQGEEYRWISNVESLVPLPDLQPRTEIFRAAEHPLSIMVTDALALRLLGAGLKGMDIVEPETRGYFNRYRVTRYRTLKGMEEYWHDVSLKRRKVPPEMMDALPPVRTGAK